jgi:hypothetical protein
MTLSKVVAAGAVALLVTSGVALAQGAPPPGRIYTFNSSPQGGCPALDWHIVTGANGALSGMIAWNNMESMAKATGTVSNGQVQMTAKEVGGQGRTATVSGRVLPSGFFVVNIVGPNVDCKNITVPFFVQPPAGGGHG